MRRCANTILLAALLTLLTSGVHAEGSRAPDYGRAGPYVGAGGTLGLYTLLSSRIESELRDQGLEFWGLEVDSNPAGGVNAQAGYRINRWVGVQADFDYLISTNIEVEDLDAAKVDNWNVMASAKVYPWDGRIQPYFIAGVGVAGVRLHDAADIGGDVDETAFAAQLGLGLESYVTENIAIVFDGTYVIETGDLDDFDVFNIGLGVMYRF